MERLVHAVAVGAHKWSLGKAKCGCTIGRYTPTGKTEDKVTCPRCKPHVKGLAECGTCQGRSGGVMVTAGRPSYWQPCATCRGAGTVLKGEACRD